MKSKTKKKEKSTRSHRNGFDAVKMMRTIRDGMSKEIRNMTFEEEKAYLEKLLSKKAAAVK